jgi:spermidine synthase
MSRDPRKVGGLLFGSGACALIYQVSWEREFRLVFGGSTAASAAVLAIFVGGLGFGSLLLGRRADRTANPLRLYARLEASIALAAAASPLLLLLVRQIYVAAGGTSALGLGMGTLLRLVLASLVVGVPTFLMGGTLPAAARAVETPDDARRSLVALLYGVNTLGAVAGSTASTFLMLESFGTRTTLWLACLVNLLVAVAANALARSARTPPVPAAAEPLPAASGAPAPFVLVAAGVVGFAFFLMELVWYRMLGPILGGTIFTFGLILAVALLGIAVGGIAYSLLGSSRPATLAGFTLTCIAEALCVLLPFAWGDGLAMLAFQARSLGTLGFAGEVAGWAVVVAITVLPTSVVAGVQFPLLIGLLGRGTARVGDHIGRAYAVNTAGAIAGSLAGGFGLLPLLTAPGCWRLVAAVLLLQGLAAAALSLRARSGWRTIAVPVALAASVVVLLFARGPTAFWRHNLLVGRALSPSMSGNSLVTLQRGIRRATRWEAEGTEASVALSATAPALGFVVNGRSDGNARQDAPTQVMSGLLGLLVHPGAPRRAMVVGLGTGSTAGWLGAVPALERVDTVELEPVVVEVARVCAAVNRDVLANPKVHVMPGDAREFLLTTASRYDLIVSEPSNPYRAGVAALFTREYYEAALRRLNDDGIFVQWVQAYWVDARTVRSVYATLASVFPEVQTWQTYSADMLLVASKKPLVLDADRLRVQLADEPYRSALFNAWRVTDLEGVLSRFVAQAEMARAVAAREQTRNTDDQNHVEFGFARTLGVGGFSLREVRSLALARGQDRPRLSGREPSWERVQDEQALNDTMNGEVPVTSPRMTPEQVQRVTAQRHWLAQEPRAVVAAWSAQPQDARSPIELAMLADSLARIGHEDARSAAEALRPFQPIEADVALAQLHFRRGLPREAAATLVGALRAYRKDPWPLPRVMTAALGLAADVARADGAVAPSLLDALSEPFAVMSLEDLRVHTAIRIAAHYHDLGPRCVDLCEAAEPHFPWLKDILTYRRDCYAARRHPRAGVAEAELLSFVRSEPVPFAAGL